MRTKTNTGIAAIAWENAISDRAAKKLSQMCVQAQHQHEKRTTGGDKRLITMLIPEPEQTLNAGKIHQVPELDPVHQTNDNPPTSRPPITTTRTLERRVTEPGHTIAGWPVPGGSANLRLLGVATTPSSLKFECPLVLERVRGHSDTVEPEVRGSRCVGPQRWSGGRVRGFG